MKLIPEAKRRRQTKRKEKEATRKKVWQKAFIKKCADIYARYKKSFEEAVEKGTLRSKDVMNLVKIMVAPMRFGKTRLAITHHIPFLFKHTEVNCVIFTSPLGSIIRQKQRLIKNTVRKLNDVEYCDHPVDAIEALEDGSKIVITMTNQAAWVGDKAIELYDSLDKSKTAFFLLYTNFSSEPFRSEFNTCIYIYIVCRFIYKK